MKISEFTAIKHIVRTNFIALLMLMVLHNRDKTKMQMRLSSLVIMNYGLHDIFSAIPIFHKIVCRLKKFVISFPSQILRRCHIPARHHFYIITAVTI